MANDYGTGVSRVLDPVQAGWTQVIWQQGKPPLDNELNLLQQMSTDWRQIMALRGTPSGWLGNGVNASEVFVTGSMWSNWFRFGQQRTGEKAAIPWAVVNGWIIPVTGTLTGAPPGSPNDSDTWNRITLDPPPSNSGDSRVDFVFLEAWLARVQPNPSTTNKPGSSTIYRYGNVEGGYTYLADDLQDPDIGFETTQRVQLQYRVRVVSGLVGLTSYPDGFDPTLVKARGAASSVTSYVFENMREELGDPGLWRAGDGSSNALGTVDGYSYAVPICAVFRRNSVAWDGDPGQNLNGGFNRNPTAADRTGYATFSTTPTLASNLTSTGTTLVLSSATNIPMPAAPATGVLIKVGDEIMEYSAVSGTNVSLITRGALGTKAEAHYAGDTVTVVAGRPDGLFADQIAKTDILDLRHSVNPNGFDYDTVLAQNLDKLLRGQLRANWKRSGGGPQGGFVFYQDKISLSAAALGVTKIDGPDNIRQIFSDAAAQQPVEFVATPPSGTTSSESITTAWSLSLTGLCNNSGGASGTFSPNTSITIPVNQFRNGLPGSDTDQVRLLGGGDGPGSVTMRIDGKPFDLIEGTHFSVDPTTSSTDLVINLLAGFPATTSKLILTINVLYGPGRGLSRRPDSIHSISFLSTSSAVMSQLSGVPANNIPTRASWALLWSKFRSAAFRGLIPVTAETYADAGSKTIVLAPFREVELPALLRTLDGSGVNVNTGDLMASGTAGVTSGSTLTDGGANFSGAGITGGDVTNGWGEVVVVSSPASIAGTYWVASGSVGVTTLNVDRTFPANVSNVVYSIYSTQGLMPLNDINGDPKWLTCDPLAVFSSHLDTTATRKNVYLPIPRNLMPGWGEVRVPIMHSDPTTVPPGGSSTFDQGINFGILVKKGTKSGRPDSEKNYVPLDMGGGSQSWASFSTLEFGTPDVQATYNASFTWNGIVHAGMRFMTDERGLGRKGLELPPFYGVARLFAVYEAQNYRTSGTAFDPDTREPKSTGGATNLLRQDVTTAAMWIEIDDDGDSTFILSEDAIDIAKSPNVISSFEAGNYVIEAQIFGFDRNSFNLDGATYMNDDARLVLTRERNQAIGSPRSNNINVEIDSPDLVVPGPVPAATEVAINYSRSPYQGDAWGSQNSQQDIGLKQGPLTTGTLYQLTSTELDEQNLTRPNQKALEVVSSVGFMTTLGSGRLSGDFDSTRVYDFRNVGYEDYSTYFPPASSSTPRPAIGISALTAEEELYTLGTEYHNCIERLPLGAYFRDKDFRGGFVNSPDTDYRPSVRSPLVYTKTYGPGVVATGVGLASNIEQDEVPVNTSTLSSGQPGEMVAHVDGESGNYGLLVNFRTNRGGSAFTLGGLRPGGEVAAIFQQAGTSQSYGSVLSGVAYLVRNTVTAIGSTEVSAGGELMMLIATFASRLDASSATLLELLSGTNGSGEGFSAVDLYRVEGRPLVVDNVRVEIDPSSIVLSKAVPLL